MLELQSLPLVEQASFFGLGEPMVEFPSHADWFEKCKYAFSVGRIVEGSHVGVHRWSSVAPNHTAYYDRLGAQFGGV